MNHHTIDALPLRARQQEPNPNMADLPSEILHAICRHLCLHCQYEHVVLAGPDLLPPAFADQKALARLSQCSRRMRDIAQPVLFHWYHGGDGEAGNGETGKSGAKAELRRLVRFLRAITRHPRLAASTQALALYGRDRDHPYTRVPDPEGSFGRAFEAAGGYLLRLRRYNGEERMFLEQLQELAIASTPALSQLCLRRDAIGGSSVWDSWTHEMPNLKYLAFPGNRSGNAENTYELKAASSLLRCLPNLDTLIAPDCWGGESVWARARFLDQPWDIMLPNLTKLSLNDVSVERLRPILEICPRLEDLEYFDDHRLYGLPSLEQYFGPLRATLRRLCYSVLPAELPDTDDEEDDEADEDVEVQSAEATMLFLHEEVTWNLDFSTFPVLEQLELEQLLLYGLVFPTDEDPREDRSSQLTTPSQLFCRVPPSLRRLRIGYITYWPTIYRDLLALAEEPTRLVPRLQAVTLEVFKAPPEHQHRHLAERLRSALGATLLVCYVAKSRMSRGLLPVRPGQPSLVYESVLVS